jgi:hypothetical protein
MSTTASATLATPPQSSLAPDGGTRARPLPSCGGSGVANSVAADEKRGVRETGAGDEPSSAPAGGGGGSRAAAAAAACDTARARVLNVATLLLLLLLLAVRRASDASGEE